MRRAHTERCASRVALSDSPRNARALLFIVPTYPPHFTAAAHLLQSMRRHATDPETASVRFITSDAAEVSSLERLIHRMDRATQTCASPRVLDVGIVALTAISQQWRVTVTNLTYASLGPDCAIPSRQSVPRCKGYTAPPDSNRFLYQYVKKLYAARYFRYDRAMLLDSDSDVVGRNFSFRALFDGFFEPQPSIFARSAAHSMDSYCDQILHLLPRQRDSTWWPVPRSSNYFGWFVDKPTIEDLFVHVERASNKSLYAVAVKAFARHRCWEYDTYSQFALASPLRHKPYRSRSWEDAVNVALPPEWRGIGASFFLDHLLHGNDTVAGVGIAGLAQLVNRLNLSVFRIPQYVKNPKRFYERFGRLLARAPNLVINFGGGALPAFDDTASTFMV